MAKPVVHGIQKCKRSNMTWAEKIKEWLVEEKEENITSADGKPIKVFSFNYDNSDDKTMSAWAKHFRNHYCSDGKIDLLRSGTGLSKRDYLLNLKFPDQTIKPGPSVRSGDFSEILIADYLEFILNYWVPRTRYSNKINRNSSPMGSDIIGFKLFDSNETNKDILTIIEAKASYTKMTENRLQKAIDDSQKDNIRIAESLNAMKQRYIEMNNIENAKMVERFENISDKPYTMFYGAAALFSNETYDEKILRTSDTSNHIDIPHLMLIVVKGDNMMNLVHELYRRAADEA